LTCVVGTYLALAFARGARVVLAPALDLHGPGASCAEAMALEVGVDVRIVRMPIAFGPRMEPDEQHPVAALVLGALAGERLASGSAAGSRVVRVAYVDDLARTLARAREEDACPLRLVAPHHAARVQDLADAVAAAATAPCSDADLALPAIADVDAPGCAPADDALGLDPILPLDEAVAITVAWFEDRIGRRSERTSGVYVAKRLATRAHARGRAV
jgi:nucleoside-diphosphate-sugar epimerase